jgi:hypothetical protein
MRATLVPQMQGYTIELTEGKDLVARVELDPETVVGKGTNQVVEILVGELDRTLARLEGEVHAKPKGQGKK